MPEVVTNQNESIIAFAKESLAAELIPMKDGNDVLVIPSGKTAVNLKEKMAPYLKTPERVRGTSNHHTLASFVAHFNRFKLPGSAIYASENVKNPELKGVYNYSHSPTEPGWGDHKAVLHCRLSDEWQTWTDGSKKPMSQREFAEFIEENIDDVQPKPDLENASNAMLKDISLLLGYPFASQQEMLTLSRGIEINEGAKAASKVNLQTGERTIQYENQHLDSENKPLKIPGLFLIRIPVFLDGAPYLLPVRLRYRLQQGVVLWSYDIYREDRAFKDAYDEICAQVSTATNTLVYIGSPEA